MTTSVIEILQEAFVNVCKSDNICQAIKEASIEVYEKIGEIMNYYGGSEWLKESKMEIMPFTKGNSKLPTSTYIFNMGTGLLCAGRALGLCQCSHCCYAQDAEMLYKESTIQYRLLQAIRWSQLSATQIANTIIHASTRSRVHKCDTVRVNESGEILFQSDIDKLSVIADLLSEHNIKMYVYSTRQDLDWTEISDNLCVLGSGWMPPIKKNGKPAGNMFKATYDIPDDAENVCGCDCTQCDVCIHPTGCVIYERIRD